MRFVRDAFAERRARVAVVIQVRSEVLSYRMQTGAMLHWGGEPCPADALLDGHPTAQVVTHNRWMMTR